MLALNAVHKKVGCTPDWRRVCTNHFPKKGTQNVATLVQSFWYTILPAPGDARDMAALRASLALCSRAQHAQTWATAGKWLLGARQARRARSTPRRALFGNATSKHQVPESSIVKHGDFESVSKLRGADLLLPLSEMAATPVELRTLYNLGKDPTEDQLVDFAQFLQRELAIRLAQRAVELARLPHGLSEKPTIRDVCGWYAEAASELVAADKPNTPAKEAEFTKLLKSMLRDHTSVVRNLALGCMEVKRDVGADEWERIRGDIDNVLTSFYTSRIGVRFLMEQHITARDRLSGFSGIIQQGCKPDEVAHNAAADATNLCYRYKGIAPEVQVVCKTNNTTVTYVSSHIHYMLTELLKNSLRAVVDEHSAAGGKLPMVKVVIVRGEEDITIRVSDEGGGIPRSQLPNMFSFLHSTAPVAPGAPGSKEAEKVRSSLDLPGSVGQMRATSSNTPVLAGWGVGLPLSRTYARYFGGDLDIKSMDGFGTDAYLHLNILGDGCENLPSKVRNSPAMRDSRAAVDAPGAFDALRSCDAYRARDY